MSGGARLPIDEALPELVAALAARSVAVLEAPPGAGKTTRVPLALLDAPWLDGRRVVMLEPRRLAARSAAHYMAAQRGERAGETVGYRVRGDTRVSARTRVEVVTEGVLARLLADDPALEDYGAVLLDEFHERSLHGDLALALVLESQQALRPDLRVLVMSATLDGSAVAALLADAEGPAPVVRSAGRMYPIETHHRPPRRDERPERVVARVVREALAAHEGDLLVFLPGAAEQRRVAALLEGDDALAACRTTVHLLHGTLPLEAQERALAPAAPGARKVVLATSVAETSLTVPGVRVVVDSGWSRVPRFDAAAGLTRLYTVRVTRASADQRRGRAGRVAPGACYRLWEPHEDATLLPRARAELLEADLAPLALLLAEQGVRDAAQLRWLDAPPAGALAQGRALLAQLGALDMAGRITPLGRRMAGLPVEPRLGALLMAAEAEGQGALGGALAALLEERDVLRGEGPVRPPADLRLRTELLHRDGDAQGGWHAASVDRDALRRVREQARALARAAGARGDDAWRWDDAEVGALVARAYPDRVAQRRLGGEPGRQARYLLRNGSGAVLAPGDALADAPWLAVAELEGGTGDARGEARIAHAAPLDEGTVRALFAAELVRETTVAWDERAGRVSAVARTRLGALVLDEGPWRDAPVEALREAVRAAVLAQLRRAGVPGWPMPEGARRLLARLRFVQAHGVLAAQGFPDWGDEALAAEADAWLAPWLDGVRSWEGVAQLDWPGALLGRLPWEQRAAVERLAPTHVTVPTGSRIALDYDACAATGEGPVLAVKLQELFGCATSPAVLDGRVPVVLHL
ncbi:MAG: ATP-dependent helicase HrpB, partial [Gemmatimonadetes bacterium]|nr:ATP-dependent helicase HrpB [Gemmatimonadota bacterium]